MALSVRNASLFPVAYTQPTGLRKKYLQDERDTHHAPKSVDLAVPMNLDAILSFPLRGPDIQWNPSFEKYSERVRMLGKLKIPRPTSVPEGYPEVIKAPWVWEGSDFQNEDYVLQLDTKDVDEVNTALAHFKGRTFCYDTTQS
jgi:hypothetical protein